MLELLVNSFVIFFVVIDPIGLAPIFMALTPSVSEARRRRMALRATLLAAIILVLFAFVGAPLLKALGVGLPAFRIAGGLLLFFLAVDMVFARHSGMRSPTASEEHEAEQRDDISVFPLAFPLIAGPGALTTILLLTGRREDDPLAFAAVLVVMLMVLGLALAALLLAARLVRHLGRTGTNVISRVLGVILAALATQFVLDGLRDEGLFAPPLQDVAYFVPSSSAT